MDATMNRFWKLLVQSVFMVILVSPLGCATLGDMNHPFQHHHKEPPLTVSVTGLVKKPGRQEIPLGGLLLADAIALAGGDLPAKFFNTPPATVLVSIDRTEGIHNFSLPLVTNDAAGKIFLRPGDKVSLKPYVASDSVRQFFRGAGGEDLRQDADAWKQVLGTDEVGQNKMAFDVPFSSPNQPNRLITIRLEPMPGSNSGDYRQGEKPKDAQPSEQIRIQSDLDRFQMAYGQRAVNTPNPGSMLHFSNYVNTSSPQYTVIVLRRRSKGRFQEYVLLRHVSTASNPDGANAERVLNAINVIPGDSVSIDIVPRIPVVLTSLAAPQLFDFAKKKPHFPKLQQRRDAVQQNLQPLSYRVNSLGQMVQPTVNAVCDVFWRAARTLQQ